MEKRHRNLNSLYLAALILLLWSTPLFSEDSAYTVFKRASDLYSKINNYSSRTEVKLGLKSQGAEDRATYVSDIQVERPNKYRIENITESSRRLTISDGSNVYSYLPEIKSYTVSVTPAYIAENLSVENGIESIGNDKFLIFSFWDNLTEKWGVNISSSLFSFAGEEIIDDRICSIIDFAREGIPMRLWIDNENYLIRKIYADLTELLRKQHMELGIDTPNISMECEEYHTAISTGVFLQVNPFEFVPPDDAVHVESFFESLYEDNDYPYLGRRVSDMEFKNHADGQKIKLSKIRSKSLVIAFIDSSLQDFYEILSDFEELEAKTVGLDTEIIVVDCAQDSETLDKKLLNRSTQLDIYNDEDLKVQQLYNISSFPVIFVTDKKQEIKHIYTSYFPGFVQKLHEDINIILGIIDPYDIPEKQQHGLEILWELPVKTLDLTVDGNITALSAGGDIYNISASGNIKKITKSGLDVTRIAKLGSGSRKIKKFDVLYRPRFHFVYVLDNKAREKWRLELEQDINDVEVTDLDGDGQEELLLATSGMDGIQLYSAEGDVIWTSTAAATVNVWDVSTGELDMEIPGKEIAYISNFGEIIITSMGGAELDTVSNDIYANFLKILPRRLRGSCFLISGNSEENEVLKILDRKGDVKWETILGYAENAKIMSVSVHPFDPLIAVSTADGQLYVFDNIGNIKAYSSNLGMYLMTDWLVTDRGQTILISGNIESGLKAYLLSEE